MLFSAGYLVNHGYMVSSQESVFFLYEFREYHGNIEETKGKGISHVILTNSGCNPNQRYDIFLLRELPA